MRQGLTIPMRHPNARQDAFCLTIYASHHVHLETFFVLIALVDTDCIHPIVFCSLETCQLSQDVSTIPAYSHVLFSIASTECDIFFV
jgi:hypothetical protein